MRIGYSMRGFLGTGVLDVPDGSLTYRRALLLRGGRPHLVAYLPSNDSMIDLHSDVFAFAFIDAPDMQRPGRPWLIGQCRPDRMPAEILR